MFHQVAPLLLASRRLGLELAETSGAEGLKRRLSLRHAMTSITTVSLNCLMGWLLLELLLLSGDQVRRGPELQGSVHIHVRTIVVLRRGCARRQKHF